MRITYTAPFRISFSLTKQEALARHDRFIEIVETARTNLEESKQPTAKSRLPDNTRLGNYGWGLYNPRRQNVPRHGEKGIDDPTWFFRDFYTLSFGERLDATGMLDLSDDPVTLKLFGTAQELSWECWLVDNTVAVLILNAEVPFSAFAACLEETVARETSLQMIEYGNAWCERILADSRQSIASASAWATIHLTEPMRADQPAPSADIFISMQSPAYGLPENDHPIFQAMWTHCVFAVSEEERKTLREIQAPFLSLTASPGQIKSWLEGGNNAYGWGISAVVQDPRFEEQWLDGLCISQYYYACIDIADTSLPRLISEQRMASLRGEDRVVMAQSKDLRQALIVLQSDYADQRTRSSAEGERALNGYYQAWRLKPLLEGLQRKVDLLSELTTTASASLAHKYEGRIQFILTIIGFLGLISLVSGIHDYLAGGYDPRDPEWLPSVAVTLSKVTVLVSSLTLVLILVAVFWVLLRWKK